MNTTNRLLNNAAMFYQSQQYKKVTAEYKKAYESTTLNSNLRYCCLSGYTSLFREEKVTASQNDIAFLNSIANDNKEKVLCRTCALFALGFITWLSGDRDKAAYYYDRAIKLGRFKKNTSDKMCVFTEISQEEFIKQHKLYMNEKEFSVMMPDPVTMSYKGYKSAGIINEIVSNAEDNLAKLEGRAPVHNPIGDYDLPAHGPEMSPSLRTPGIPVGINNILTKPELQELVDILLGPVTTNQCNCCAKKNDGIELKVCSKCKMVSYCSLECQKKDWKLHKSQCKAPNEFKDGDLVICHGLKSNDYNGNVLQVYGDAPNGRFKTGHIGGDKFANIKPDNIRHVTPALQKKYEEFLERHDK